MLLTALSSVVLYFAQAAPDAAQPPAPPKLERVVVPSEKIDTSLTTTPEVKGKTVSPLVVTPQVKPQASAQVQRNTVVCHTEPVLGSMFPKKICATQGEIAERRANDQEQLREWTALRPYKAN